MMLCTVLLCHTVLLAQQKRWEFEFTKEVDTLPPGGWVSATASRSDYIKKEHLKVIIDGESGTMEILKDNKRTLFERVERNVMITQVEGAHMLIFQTDVLGASRIVFATTDDGRAAIQKTNKIAAGHEQETLYGGMKAASTYGINAFRQSIKKGTNSYFYDADTGHKEHVVITAEGGSAIHVDGVYKNNGRWIGFLEVGKHQIELRKQSHRTATSTITVKVFTDSEYTFPALEPITGVLSIKSNPSGARVLVDGRMMGHTPLFIPDMMIGDYRVEIEKDYFETVDTRVTVEEGKLTSRSHTLVSRVPFTLSAASPDYSILFYIEGDEQWHRTPYSTFLPEGDYRIRIPRQYNERGTLKEEMVLHVDSLHQSRTVMLRNDNNYDLATFVGIDYDMGLQALAFNFGSNPGKHFMFDLNFYKGLGTSETIYWSAQHTASLENIDLQSFNYRHWALSLRMGPTFWCGPYLRLSPQLGLQYLKLQEHPVGDINTMKSMVKGGYVSGLASMRIRIALAEHWGVHVTPQYKVNLTGNAVLPDVSDVINGWVNGFSLKIGASFYFY